MKIRLRDKWPNGDESTFDLRDIVESRSYSYDSEFIDTINSKAIEGISFTEKLIELLYEKGLLNDQDITRLVASIDHVDEDSVSVVHDLQTDQ